MGKSVKYSWLKNFHKNLLTDVNLRLISLAKHAEWGMACFGCIYELQDQEKQ
jgi:hypothetical protein